MKIDCSLLETSFPITAQQTKLIAAQQGMQFLGHAEQYLIQVETGTGEKCQPRQQTIAIRHCGELGIHIVDRFHALSREVDIITLIGLFVLTSFRKSSGILA